MNIYKILHILVLCCVINEGLAWFGRRSSSSSRTSRRSSSSSSSRSGSSSRGSGWFGGGTSRQSKPSPKPVSKPKPPARTPKPKPSDTGKKVSGWWSGSSRRGSGWMGGTSRQSKPSPKPTKKPRPQATTQKPKTKDIRKKLSDWWSGWWSRRSKGNVPKPKPTPKQPHLPSTSDWTYKSVLSQPKTIPKPETALEKLIEKYEGLRLKAYDAQPNNPKVHDTTIGIRFNFSRHGAKKTFEEVLPDLDFNKTQSGEQTITEDQARALLKHDLDKIYVPRAKSMISEEVYDKLPQNVKNAVVNAVYRGDLGKKTATLIKDGKWSEVVKEYLNHYQYKNAEKLGIPGVKKRMDDNNREFATMIPKE